MGFDKWMNSLILTLWINTRREQKEKYAKVTNGQKKIIQNNTENPKKNRKIRKDTIHKSWKTKKEKIKVSMTI